MEEHANLDPAARDVGVRFRNGTGASADLSSRAGALPGHGAPKRGVLGRNAARPLPDHTAEKETT